MATLTSLANVKLYLGITVTTYDTLLTLIIDGVSDQIEKFCGRTFNSTAYSKERYDGTGLTNMFLNQYPVISLSRISDGLTTPLVAKNTSTDATYAIVTVGLTSITFVVVGGTNDGTNPLTRATYSTLTLLNAAINALGDGWEGTLSSGYEATPVTELLTDVAQPAIDQNASLSIPSSPISGFEVYADNGEVYYAPGFSSGHKNVVADYTAGYATIPDGLERATILLVVYAYKMTLHDPSLIEERLGDYRWRARPELSMLCPHNELLRLLGPYMKYYVK